MLTNKEDTEIAANCTLSSTLLSNRGYFSGLTWSPDGKSIAACSDGTVTIWDARYGKLRQSLFRSKWIGATVAWSPDGRLLAASSPSKTIQLWHTATWKHHHTVKSPIPSTSSIAWSPDSRYLVAVSNEGDAVIWNASTWVIQVSLPLVENESYAMVSSHQSTSASFNDAMKYFIDSKTERLLIEEDWLRSRIEWSPDGHLLAVSLHDNSIQLWDTETWKPHRILKGPAALVSK